MMVQASAWPALGGGPHRNFFCLRRFSGHVTRDGTPPPVSRCAAASAGCERLSGSASLSVRALNAKANRCTVLCLSARKVQSAGHR